MTDGQILYLTLTVLYLIECVHWSPATFWVLRARARRGFRLVPLRLLPETTFGTLVLAEPLPPFGEIFDAAPQKLSMGPDGVLAWQSLSLPDSARPEATSQHHPSLDSNEIRADGPRLSLSSSSEAIHLGSRVLAQHWAEALRRWAAAYGSNQRDLALDLQRDQGDVAACRKRHEECRSTIRPLRWASHAVFAIVFLIAPALVTVHDFESQWKPLLLLLISSLLLTATLFARAHRTLYPEARTERIAETLLVALCPTVAIRASDKLTKDALITFHPATIAATLLTGRALEEALAALLRECAHPLQPLPEGAPAPLSDGARRLRSAERSLVEQVAITAGLEPKRLLRAPDDPKDPTQKSYCPRCLESLTLAEATCSTCAIPTVPFSPVRGAIAQD